MTAPSIIDPTEFLHEQLSQASPDLLRQMLTTFINTLMSADADAVCGAAWGERSEQRTNTRNGYRHRDFDTRAGTIDVAIPKLRNGTGWCHRRSPSRANSGCSPSGRRNSGPATSAGSLEVRSSSPSPSPNRGRRPR
ncbi:hypothetical protein GCM10023175_11760 [Pseudonocardia xishanensis]|uniref:Mutator family transposase n=1 Tax=Pseudonocardia xishanensis TaxID=630995 RepID=A0ABP8RIU1_9PSEU